MTRTINESLYICQPKIVAVVNKAGLFSPLPSQPAGKPVRIQLVAGGDLMIFYPLAIATLAALAAIASAIFNARSFRVFISQFKHADKTERGRMFLQISEKWSAIYLARNSVLGSSPVITYAHILQLYGSDARKFLEKDEKWKQLRQVCNFFETLGLLLQGDYIDKESLFTLVTIDIFSEVVDGKSVDVPEGVMYRALKGPIEYLRKHYRVDIYKYYDDAEIGILSKYKRYIAAARPC